MSFAPFLGGKRVCLGKSFSEFISRIIISAILMQFDFKYVNLEHQKNKPRHDITFFQPKVILMKIRTI